MHKLIQDKIEDLKKICQIYDVKSMYLFGSACTDKFKETSDIDILISFKDISIEKYTEILF